MKKGNLRTVKKYGSHETRYAIEVRTFGGTWRQLASGGAMMVFATEDESIKKMLSFFNPRPLTLRADK